MCDCTLTHMYIKRSLCVDIHVPTLCCDPMTHSVTEGDLLDVLKMHGAQKLLRQILTSLKKDKLIKTYCSHLNWLIFNDRI